MRRLRYSVPYIAGKNLPKDSDPAPCGAGPRQPDSLPPRNDFNPLAPCGAGPPTRCSGTTPRDFNPPAPCGAGRRYTAPCCRRSHFNPPAPCGAGPVEGQLGYEYSKFQSTRPLRGGTAILHKKTVQNIAYCTKSAFTLTVLSGFLALMRPFFCQTCTNFGANLPKNRCSLPVRTLIPSGPPPADSRH